MALFKMLMLKVIGDSPFLYSDSSTLTYFRILHSWEFPIKSI